MYSGLIGRLENEVKIYIDGEFCCKTDCPESTIDLQLSHEFDIKDVDYSNLHNGKVYITTEGKENRYCKECEQYEEK
jgi:hypothetical protein